MKGKRTISGLVMLCLLVASTLALKACDGIGEVSISAIPLPDEVELLGGGTYTYSGKVLVSYKTADDIGITDYVNIAVLNDDGTDFYVIFSGVIPTLPKSNGIRFMPFQDNTRILLGDYVLECTPDIDNCTSTEIVPIVYPAILDTDPSIGTRWSEVIIAPDNIHMAWTILTSNWLSGQAIGTLTRTSDSYVLENVQLLSTPEIAKEDPDNPGYIIPPPVLRGGEVKQFVRGGNAISVVGAKKYVTGDSVIQYLNSEKVEQVTYTPGYDETTILSPDERLGIVMSSRFSPETDCAILGVTTRPTYTGIYLNGMVYSHAVTGVRQARSGNIGPVLVNIDLSMADIGYKGIPLNTDEDWLMASPMSWHPGNKKAMWVEVLRGSLGTRRLQKVYLHDYIPESPVPIETTTDDIPYGITDLTQFANSPSIQGKIAGKHSGYIDFVFAAGTTPPYLSGYSESQYVNFSDDGCHFYNGYETYDYNFLSESTYEANLQLTGIINHGEMDLRATFSSLILSYPAAALLFDTAADGLPKSYGYATYNCTTLYMDDLIP